MTATVGFPDFVPKARIVTNVTNALDATITTEEPHGYADGQIVRLHVFKAPASMNTMEANGVIGQVKVIDDTNFFSGIDTRSLFPFATPSFPPPFTRSHVCPVSGTWNNQAVFSV